MSLRAADQFGAHRLSILPDTPAIPPPLHCCSATSSRYPARSLPGSVSHKSKSFIITRAASTEESQSLPNSSRPNATAEELSDVPVGGSIVQEFLGSPLNPFSRPTQILTPDEVHSLPKCCLSSFNIKKHLTSYASWQDELHICIVMQVLRGLYSCVHQNAKENYLAFYSSRLGGITVDPALMVVPMDDHLVHRGHAVFDTAMMTQVGQKALRLATAIVHLAPETRCAED